MDKRKNRDVLWSDLVCFECLIRFCKFSIILTSVTIFSDVLLKVFVIYCMFCFSFTGHAYGSAALKIRVDSTTMENPDINSAPSCSSEVKSVRNKRTPKDFIFGKILGEGSFSTVSNNSEIRL